MWCWLKSCLGIEECGGQACFQKLKNDFGDGRQLLYAVYLEKFMLDSRLKNGFPGAVCKLYL